MPNMLKHETRQMHKSALQFWLSTASCSNTSLAASNVPAHEVGHGPLYELLYELSDSKLPIELYQQPSEQGLDWDATGDSFEGGIASPHVSAKVAALASSLQEWMVDDGAEVNMDLDEVLEERSEESSLEHQPDEDGEGMSFFQFTFNLIYVTFIEDPILSGSHHACHCKDNPEDPEWFPWADKEVCSMGTPHY
jgi:hypothetical protein